MPFVSVALVAAGAGVALWLRRRDGRGRALPQPLFDEDAEIAIAVVRHELSQRSQQPSPVHVLFGLLQVEAVTEAIAATGGDVAALEDRVLDALAADGAGDPEGFHRLFAWASVTARNGGRPISCVDLWAYLGGAGVVGLFAAAAIDARAVLFRLVHGEPEPDLAPAHTSDVFVVLRNDPYSTMDLVVELLTEDFGLPKDRAEPLMRAVHEAERGVVGRYPLAVARPLVLAARARAGAGMWPLWIGVEPA